MMTAHIYLAKHFANGRDKQFDQESINKRPSMLSAGTLRGITDGSKYANSSPWTHHPTITRHVTAGITRPHKHNNIARPLSLHGHLGASARAGVDLSA